MRPAIIAFALLAMSIRMTSAKEVDAIERIDRAEQVFREIMATSDKSIPQDLLEKAHCIGLIPGLKKGAFVVGAQYGVGVILCRAASGRGWSGPSTIKAEGGSVGFQIGGGEVDVVFLVMDEAGARGLMKSEFALGGEAGAMAGPVGRSSSAMTDARFRAGILSWSRSRGAFAGIALKGTTLRSSDDSNEKIYGKRVRHVDILKGVIPPPAAAAKLIATLNKYSVKEMRGGSAAFRSPFVNSFAPQSDKDERQARPSARGDARLIREVRHELVMLPYYNVFDNLSYRVENGRVVLIGQVTRPTLKTDAERVVKDIEGVEHVENQIEVLPLSPQDDRIRMAVYRAIYGHTALNRYALAAVPSIHIIVKNGQVTLEGVAANEGDRNIANIQANSVSGVFSVTNNLRLEKE